MELRLTFTQKMNWYKDQILKHTGEVISIDEHPQRVWVIKSQPTTWGYCFYSKGKALKFMKLRHAEAMALGRTLLGTPDHGKKIGRLDAKALRTLFPVRTAQS